MRALEVTRTRRWASAAALLALLAGAGCGATARGGTTPAAATLLVAPNGSDSARCTVAAPCKSFDRAYHVARPGQVVEVAGGTYGDEDVRFDPSKPTGPDVVFRPVKGAAVTLGSIVLGPDMATRGASHVTFEGFRLTGDLQVIGCGAGPGEQCLDDSVSGGTYVTFRHLTVQGHVGFFCASCGHVSIIGGTIGPASYGNPCNGSNHPEVQNVYDASLDGSRKLKRSHDLLIDGVTWQNFSSCVAFEDHTECLQIEPADDVIIRRSIFRRCDTITVNLANDLAGDSVSAAGYRAPNDVLIENNFFDEAHSLPGAPTYYALNIRECTNCIVRYNSWLQPPRLPTGEVAQNVQFVGNVGPFQPWDCDRPGIVFSHDVWVGAKCSSTDRNVKDAGFLDPADMNLHLSATSPARRAGDRRNHPRRDIDGQLRPTRTAPDAGADQRTGGR